MSFYLWHGQVARAGTQLLPAELADEMTRPSEASEDHRARRRQAALVGLTAPSRAPERRTSPADLGLARISGRILVATGPLPVVDLAAAIGRGRTPRGTSRIVTVPQLAALLWTAAGMTIDPDGTCQVTEPRAAHPGDLELLQLARESGRNVHSRPQVIDMLTQVGYARSIEPTLVKHPLLVHIARGRWTILGCENHNPR